MQVNNNNKSTVMRTVTTGRFPAASHDAYYSTITYSMSLQNTAQS